MKKILIVLIGSAGVISFLNALTIPVLILEQQGEIVFLRHIKPGDTFLLGYLHSVAGTDVWEKFIIDDKFQIILTETMFQGQGAGLPHNLSANEKLTREGSWFKITGMRRILPEINWRVDSQWQSRFRFRQEEMLSITDLTGNGLVQIKISQMKLLNWLQYNLKKFLTKEVKQT